MALRVLLALSLVQLILAGDIWDMMMTMKDSSKNDGGDYSGMNYNGWGDQNTGMNFGGWGKRDSDTNWNGWGNKKAMWQMMVNMMGHNDQATTTQAPDWAKDHNKESIEAYLRWCAEKKERQLLMTSKKHFLTWMSDQEEERESAMAKSKIEVEQRERTRKIKMQYDQWKIMFTQQKNFETLLHKFRYMKKEYMSTMMAELLKFCKCADVNDQLSRYFYYIGGNQTLAMPLPEDTMFDLDNIQNLLQGDIGDVALKLRDMSLEARNDIFFGGLVNQLCAGAKVFAAKVKTWEIRLHMWV